MSEVVLEPSHGTVEITVDRRVLYSPDPRFCGTDVFTYMAEDQHDWLDVSLVRVNVLCAGNTQPFAGEDIAITPEGVAVILDVLANDEVTANYSVDINGNGGAFSIFTIDGVDNLIIRNLYLHNTNKKSSIV